MQMHLAFSLFPGCISSVYILHISCRLLPACIGSFHVFSIFSSICNFCLFSTCIVLSHFFPQLSCVPLSDLHFPIPFFALFLHFFPDVNILGQAQFDSTILYHIYIIYIYISIYNYLSKCIQMAGEIDASASPPRTRHSSSPVCGRTRSPCRAPAPSLRPAETYRCQRPMSAAGD